jgi:hypothetical protein
MRIASFVLAFVFSVVPSLSFVRADDSSTPEGDIAETLGAMLVAYSTEAHVNVGLVADALVQDAIEAEDAKKLLGLSKMFLADFEEKTEKLSNKSSFDEEEQKIFAHAASLFQVIGAEVAAVEAYIESEDDSDLEAYVEARKIAISKLEKWMK